MACRPAALWQNELRLQALAHWSTTTACIALETQNLVINQIDSLDSEEEDLVKQNFAKADLDKVLILEEGREPASLFKSLGMVFGGIVLTLGGAAWMFLGRADA